MTTEEVTSKLLDYAITLVDYCCNQEECNEARLFELEAINDLNEEWVGKIDQIGEEVGTNKLKLLFWCLAKLGRNVYEESLDFSEIDSVDDYYECELSDDDFSAYRCWCSDIHNETNKHCGYIDLSKANSLMESDLGDKDLFIFIWLISREPSMISEGKKYLITDHYKSPSVKFELAELKAIVKFEMVLSGGVLKPVIPYDKPFLHDSTSRGYDYLSGYSAKDKQYVQIEQLFDVLSDYHASNGILDKYLKLYHVYEELMIRIALVKYTKRTDLNARNLAEFASPRKAKDEKTSLTELIKAMLKSPTNPKSCEGTLLTEINSIWNQLAADTKDYLNNWYKDEAPNIESAEQFDVLVAKPNNLSGVSEYLSFVIYQTRCRIVHNKATEFHLTYQKLDSKNKAVLELFLIPLMEMLCVKTLAEIPDYLRYDTDKIVISLY